MPQTIGQTGSFSLVSFTTVGFSEFRISSADSIFQTDIISQCVWVFLVAHRSVWVCECIIFNECECVLYDITTCYCLYMFRYDFMQMNILFINIACKLEIVLSFMRLFVINSITDRANVRNDFRPGIANGARKITQNQI